MQVEAGHDGHLRPHHRAYAPQQFRFAVVEMVGDHGAVQVQVDGVDGPRIGEAADDRAANAFERVLGDMGRRARRTPGESDELVAVCVQRGDGTRRGNVGAREARRDLCAIGERRPPTPLFERGEGGLRRCKRVRFMLETADRDARHACPTLQSKPIIAGFTDDVRAMLHRRYILRPLVPRPRGHLRANPFPMLSIVLYVIAIILCGSIGGTTGWALSRWMGLAGVAGSLVALCHRGGGGSRGVAVGRCDL